MDELQRELISMKTLSEMTQLEYLTAQALANPNICTGIAQQWELHAWFGKNRSGITKEEIIAHQALDAAKAAIAIPLLAKL